MGAQGTCGQREGPTPPLSSKYTPGGPQLALWQVMEMWHGVPVTKEVKPPRNKCIIQEGSTNNTAAETTGRLLGCGSHGAPAQCQLHSSASNIATAPKPTRVQAAAAKSASHFLHIFSQNLHVVFLTQQEKTSSAKHEMQGKNQISKQTERRKLAADSHAHISARANNNTAPFVQMHLTII